ncbi:MAG: MBL fold metallo-hydrolase [Candidatus Sericytochromatia bacterium]
MLKPLKLLLLLLILSLLLSAPALAKGRIARLDTGLSNVYLIKGDKPILVDTSGPGHEAEIETWLKQNGVEPKDLAYIILTHGHADHAGGAAYFARKYQIPLMAGRGDMDMIHAGRVGELKPTSLLAGMLRLFVNVPYEPFEPTSIIDQEISLKAYGIDGRVLPLPGGHTRGSLAVILDDTHEALVGDLVRGDLFIPGLADEHFFHENRQLARWQLWDLITHQGVKGLYPGHFEGFSADEVRVRFFPEGHFAWP